MQSIKTAISIQKSLFEEAESLAYKMKVSRSRLFALALEEYIHRQQSRELLAQINAAYADESDPYAQSLPTEYDFTGGVRGKHYRAMQSGYTMTIHQADGTTVVKEVKPPAGAIVLEPDVRAYFPDSESVNATLRSLIRLIPTQQKAAAQKHEA